MVQRCYALVVIGGLLLGTSHVSAQTRGTRPPASASTDLAAGKKIFDAQCAWCHGNDGDGGMGPNLQGKLRHAADLKSITGIIANGIPGTDMRGFTNSLTERARTQTSTYVQSLARAVPRPVAGNPLRGADLYRSTGCGGCHTIAGTGSAVGPELTEIAARRGPAYLRESIVKPAAAHPSGFLVVRAVPKSGTEVRGVRVIEDVFWISIRDAGGTVHTLEKSELTRVDREIDASLMPSYESRLSTAQLDDMVAYLSTLRGAK